VGSAGSESDPKSVKYFRDLEGWVKYSGIWVLKSNRTPYNFVHTLDGVRSALEPPQISRDLAISPQAKIFWAFVTVITVEIAFFLVRD
jgi:hypothetical protein